MPAKIGVTKSRASPLGCDGACAMSKGSTRSTKRSRFAAMNERRTGMRRRSKRSGPPGVPAWNCQSA